MEIRAARGDTDAAAAVATLAAETTASAANDPASNADDSGDGSAAGAFDLASNSRALGYVIGSTLHTLPGVKDAETATAALPALEKASESLNTIVTNFESAPQKARNALKNAAYTRFAKFKSVANAVLDRNGVREVIGPVVDQMVGSMQVIAQ